MSHAETTARRSLLNGLGVAALAGVALSAPAQAAKKKSSRFEPARHPEDAWMDALPGTHRVFIDTDSASGAGNGLRYATNILNAQTSGYKGTDQDMAIIVCLRHASTSLGFNDAMWAKYGSSLGAMMGAGGPRGAGGAPPAAAPGGAPAAALGGAPAAAAAATKNAQARNIADAAKRGVHFAICGMATSLMSGMIARQAGSTADAVLAELTANIVPNGHIVPAGVMALTRAQEYGYSFLYSAA